MIFVFIEDGTLDVIENLEEAQRRYEGIDVESSIYGFYDDRGHYLTPEFIVPNRHGKFLWLFPWCESGVFELRHRKTETTEDPIWLALLETRSVNPNKWFADLDQVKDHLRKNGALVDRPAG